MKTKIRRLETKDITALEELYFQFWNEHSNIDMMLAQYKELTYNDDYIFLIAEVENKVAGSIMGVVCHELYGECKPFLIMEDLVVDPCFRKTGVGKILVTELEKKAKEKNCYQILFMTESDRIDAINFYESLGFDSKKNIGFKRMIV